MPVAVQGTPTVTQAGAVANLSGTSPSGIASGEILIAHLAQRMAVSGTLPNLTPPTGWTSAIWFGSTSIGSWFSFKLSPTAGEDLTYVWTSDKVDADVTQQIVVIHRLSGADTAAQPELYSTAVNASATTINFPALASSTALAGALLMAFGVSGTADTSPPIDNITAWANGYVEAWDASQGASGVTISAWGGAVEQAAAGVAPATTATAYATLGTRVVHMAVKPGGDTTPPAAPTGLTATAITE